MNQNQSEVSNVMIHNEFQLMQKFQKSYIKKSFK